MSDLSGREASEESLRARDEFRAAIAEIEQRLVRGEITESDWHREVGSVVTPVYLAGENPRAQSGFSGDDARWEVARRLMVDAIDRDGTFLDVGCASGYLMESVVSWAADDGHRIEPYGVDIAPELVELAKGRLPRWRDRIHAGNAMDWGPPRRFDFVRTGLDYVPTHRRADLISRLLRDMVSPSGRLIVGTFNEQRDEFRAGPSLEETVARWGFLIAGRSERPHRDANTVYRAFWIVGSEKAPRT